MTRKHRTYTHYYTLTFFSACLFYLIFILRTAFVVNNEIHFTLFDDAMISMRYAKHLVEGHGLVWNASQEPVEGYTNFLYTLLMALIHLIPVPESKLSLLAMVLNVIILLLNIWIVKLIAKKIAPDSFLVILSSMVMVAFYYPLIYWSLRGMEVGAITLAINYSIFLAFELQEKFELKKIVLSALILGISILIRMDALIPGLLISGFIIWGVKSEFRRKSLFILVTSLLFIIFSQTLFRIFYYGDFLPNTYYLKVTGVSFLERVLRGGRLFTSLLLLHLYPMLIPVLTLSVFNPRKLWLNSRAYLLLLVFIGQALYSIYVGGDAWEWMAFSNRYICIGIPALILLCNLSLSYSLEDIKNQGNSFKVFIQSMLMFTGLMFLFRAGLVFLTKDSRWLELIGIPSTYFGGLASFRMIVFSLLSLVGLSLWVLSGISAAKITKKIDLTVSNLPEFKRSMRFSTLVILISTTLWLLVNGSGFSRWVLGNAIYADYDADMARLGLMIQQGTPPDTVVAVAAAGAISYFSQRPTIDLMGKSDRVIARMEPVSGFIPGHNKWDYTYSIGKLRPDVIAHLFSEMETDVHYILSLGYLQLPNGLYIHSDTYFINKEVISQGWEGVEHSWCRTQEPVQKC